MQVPLSPPPFLSSSFPPPFPPSPPPPPLAPGCEQGEYTQRGDEPRVEVTWVQKQGHATAQRGRPAQAVMSANSWPMIQSLEGAKRVLWRPGARSSGLSARGSLVPPLARSLPSEQRRLGLSTYGRDVRGMTKGPPLTCPYGKSP